MRAWRTYIVGSQLLAYQLNRELQDEHNLTLADYEILVRLSEQPEQRMRMSQLAGEVASSKSRLSHQITRMERAGLVTRVDCPSDGRGVFAQLTETGSTRLKTAAPIHLDGVRSHLIDLLTPAEHTALVTIFAKVQDHLAGR
ncbi:MarR family winged helix-turn-helix transcriptional regulator [Crossiella sp. NPDC003009]